MNDHAEGRVQSVSVIRNCAPLKIAVMSVFVFRNRSRSSCPSIDILAASRYFHIARFKPSRQGGQKRILVLL